MRKFLILNKSSNCYVSMKAKNETELKEFAGRADDADILKNYEFFELTPVKVSVRKVVEIN